MSDRWWWWPSGAAHHGRPVLFFPPAGADQGTARPLLPTAGGIRLGVLRLPGRAARHDEPAPDRLEPLVEEIAASVAAIRGPEPVLVGHSFGGLLAYLVAGALERRTRRVARLVAVAATAPTQWARDVGPDRDAFIARRTQRVLSLGGVSAPVAEDPEWEAHVHALVATDIALATELTLHRLSCPVTAITALSDPLSGESARWAEATAGEVELVSVPGDHFFYRTRPELLTTRLRLECALLDGSLDVH